VNGWQFFLAIVQGVIGYFGNEKALTLITQKANRKKFSYAPHPCL